MYWCRRLCPVRNRNIMVCWLRVIPWMGSLGWLLGWSLPFSSHRCFDKSFGLCMSCLHPAVRVVILLWQVDLLLCSPICCSVQEAIEGLSVVLKGPAVVGKPLDCCILYFWAYIGLGGLTWHQREGRCFCCKTWECGGAQLLLLWQQLLLCSW